jgi:hypothetical protein
MIKAHEYGAFKYAAQKGRLHIVEKLIKIVGDNLQEMVKADDYGAFRYAAAGGHLNIIEKLMNIEDVNLPEMIKAKNYEARGSKLCSLECFVPRNDA